MFGGRVRPAALIDKIGRIGRCGAGQHADGDADQAKACAKSFARQQFAAGGEDFRRELSWGSERTGARAQAEVGGLELERDGRARESLRLEAR